MRELATLLGHNILNLKQCLRLSLFITNMLKVLRNVCKSEIRLNVKQCLRLSLFHHKDAQSA